MNALEAVVVQILSEPYFECDKWWVVIRYDCWGTITQSKLMFNTEEEAKNVFIGFKFLT